MAPAYAEADYDQRWVSHHPPDVGRCAHKSRTCVGPQTLLLSCIFLCHPVLSHSVYPIWYLIASATLRSSLRHQREERNVFNDFEGPKAFGHPTNDLDSVVGVSGCRIQNVTGHLGHSPRFVLGEVLMRVANNCLCLSLEDSRYRAVLQDPLQDLVMDLIHILGRRHISINETTYDTVATLSHTVEDMGLTAILIFNVWGTFERPIYQCVPFFFHVFCSQF